MSSVSSAGKTLDPKDDVSGPEFHADMTFFRTTGGLNLIRDLFWTSVHDIVQRSKSPDVTDTVRISADWFKTPMGRDTVEFLMPSVSADRIIAKLYEDPQLFLTEMAKVNKGVIPETLRLAESGVSLDLDTAAKVFQERPEVAEEDRPLPEEHHGGEDFPHEDSSSPSPSWG